MIHYHYSIPQLYASDVCQCHGCAPNEHINGQLSTSAVLASESPHDPSCQSRSAPTSNQRLAASKHVSRIWKRSVVKQLKCGLHRSWHQAGEQATSPWRPKLGTSIKQPQRVAAWCCMQWTLQRIQASKAIKKTFHFANMGPRPSPISSPSDEYPSIRRLKCWRQRCVKKIQIGFDKDLQRGVMHVEFFRAWSVVEFDLQGSGTPSWTCAFLSLR